VQPSCRQTRFRSELAEPIQCGDPFLRRRAAGDLQHADRFDVTVTALEAAQRLTRQRSARRGDRVDRVRLALPPTDLPVRPVNLGDSDAAPGEVPAQAGPIRPVPSTPARATSPWDGHETADGTPHF